MNPTLPPDASGRIPHPFASGRAVPMGPAPVFRMASPEDSRVTDNRKPLELACDEQDSKKHHLVAAIEAIEARVSAVQRAPRDEKPAPVAYDAPPNIGTSPIVRHVEETTRLLASCTARLHAVLDSLEI